MKPETKMHVFVATWMRVDVGKAAFFRRNVVLVIGVESCSKVPLISAKDS